MRVFRIRHVLYLLRFMVVSMCMNEAEYEGKYMENYDNEISQEQQEGESPTPCQPADLSRWDKLFIALEDSHMRQNMLLESLERCCGGMVHLRTQLEKLSGGTCQQCVLSMESACKAQVERASHMLQKGLLELRDEEAERETRLNTTLQMLLRSEHEEYGRLKRPEDSRAVPSGAADSRMGRQMTPRPEALGATFTLGMKPLSTGFKEQEVTSPPSMTKVERALVAIATELERVRQHLSRVIEQAGMLRNDRGDT